MESNQNLKSAVKNVLKRRRISVRKDSVVQMKSSELRQGRKAYAKKVLQMLQVDYKTKRNKYVSKKQIQKLIQQLS